MKSNVISNIISLDEKPDYLRFSVVFIDGNGVKEEFVFFDESITLCVLRTIGLVNYMFRFNDKEVVFIYPTNSHSSYRTIYCREKGAHGQYNFIKCQWDFQLDLPYVMDKWNEA